MTEAGYKDFVLAVDCVLLAPAMHIKTVGPTAISTWLMPSPFYGRFQTKITNRTYNGLEPKGSRWPSPRPRM